MSSSNTKIVQYAVAVVSSLVSGLVSIIISVAIERFGGLLAGVVSTVPSIVLVDMAGGYLTAYVKEDYNVTANVARKYQSLFVSIPIGIVANDIYLHLWSVRD